MTFEEGSFENIYKISTVFFEVTITRTVLLKFWYKMQFKEKGCNSLVICLEQDKRVMEKF